jgi:hypothetical protein
MIPLLRGDSESSSTLTLPSPASHHHLSPLRQPFGFTQCKLRDGGTDRNGARGLSALLRPSGCRVIETICPSSKD